MESSPFDSTLFFPVSGDPIGANHFAAAEWSLRRAEGIERVTFVLSNGRHPDPTKADAAVPVGVRLAITCDVIVSVLTAMPTMWRAYFLQEVTE